LLPGGFETTRDRMVSTSWFSGKKLEHGRFPEGALKLARISQTTFARRYLRSRFVF
jgi:hypothetical protein